MSTERGTPPTVRAGDLRTIAEANEVLTGKSKKGWFGRILPFLGPAFIACVAYMDPGNFATNISGGAKFGYELLWVILGSNLLAMLIQSLSAKLGIATGTNLPEHCRNEFARPVSFGMWVVAELVAIATDLAEFLGAALGFNLLFGMPLWAAGILTGIITFLILGLERYGFRPLEVVIASFVGIVGVSYLLEMFIVKPPMDQVLYHMFVPGFSGAESVLIATGILGATVMPHVVYLHSALTQDRIVVKDAKLQKRLFRFELVDVIVAMSIAGLVNMAMLIMAAATFHGRALTNVVGIEQAHLTLTPLLGRAAAGIFALSLLASGLSSTTVGTMAGQVIMQGFMHRRIPIWVRRLVTMVPALLVIIAGLDPTRVLILSQVVLSFGLPFAVIPLIMFTARRDLMGELVNRRFTTILASGAAVLIICLNLYLIYQLVIGAA